MTATIKEQLCDSYHFPGSTNCWKDKYFLMFFVSRNDLKKYQLYQFLASQTYGEIWHLFKIFCNFPVSENFDMSAVYGKYMTETHVLQHPGPHV